MSGHPYQYVVLRCVPRVDREEFCNIAVVVYCQALGYLGVGTPADAGQLRDRLRALSPELDLARVESAVDFAAAVCDADVRAGGAAAGDQGTRFGFLKAPRSTVVQPGPVHGGRTDDPAAELARLVEQLVG